MKRFVFLLAVVPIAAVACVGSSRTATESFSISPPPTPVPPLSTENMAEPKPLTSEPKLTYTKPNAICEGGRMISWQATPPPIPQIGFQVRGDPAHPLPPYPGDVVHIDSRAAHSGGSPSWTGTKVRIYAYPSLDRGLFWPFTGKDANLRECLDQAAYYLGGGTFDSGGGFDFPLTIPDYLSKAGGGGVPMAVFGGFDYRLFAVTDTGVFAEGPVVRFVPPYTLHVSPTSTELGRPVTIEGGKLEPEGKTIAVRIGLPWEQGDRVGTAGLALGTTTIRSGRIHLEATIPTTVDVPNVGRVPILIHLPQPTEIEITGEVPGGTQVMYRTCVTLKAPASQ